MRDYRPGSVINKRMEITRTALVMHTTRDMYRLVLDVPSYPIFLNWCSGARVIEQTPSHQVASLDISIGGLNHQFTTSNRLQAPEVIELALRDGPFSHLAGSWQFKALGSTGCKVTLMLGFDFSNSMLSSAFRRGFTRVADKLVEDFVQRADRIYSS